MKNHIFSIIGAVVGYMRRRRLDALYRRTSENGMWKAELPEFLNSNRTRLPEALDKGNGSALDAPIVVDAADGRMCFMRDGVRLVCLGARE